MKRIVQENILKNLIVLGVLSLAVGPVDQFITQSAWARQAALAAEVLVAMSIIAVIACFGAFAFTYEKINPKSIWQRGLAHGTTGSLLLVIGISLIFVHSLLSIVLGPFWILDGTIGLLYVACIGYDFWDLTRVQA